MSALAFNRRRLAAAASLLGAALLLLVTFTILAPDADPAPPTGSDACASPEAQRFVVGAKLIELGFDSANIRYEGEFDLSLPGVQDRGAGSFSEESITSKEALVAFLNGDAPAEVAARQRVLESIPETGHDRALDGSGWTGVQFVSPITFVGNTIYVNGQAVDAGHRESLTGDIWWFYVGRGCTIFVNATLRGPCGNPQTAFPVPPGETPPGTVPPGTTPPGTVPPGTVPPVTTTVTGGKQVDECASSVCVTVVPPTPRPPAPTTPPPAPAPTTPATTLVPMVPDNPTCPGGVCPTHPVPTTVAPPVTPPPTSSTVPVVTAPPSG